MTAATELPNSALDIFLEDETPKDSPYPGYLHHLTLQILHNLQYQHRWTDLKVHTKAPVNGRPFPRPLVSGLPPKRLYVHPDEQAEILKHESLRKDQRGSLSSGADDEVSALEKPEMEWVLPSHLREKWSLRRFAEIFDAMDEKTATDGKPWEGHKRVVLALLQDDSTVVYYVRFPLCLWTLFYFIYFF
jgi:tRNA-splicing endonuclease subunit Sen15